jgi:hypothetical protein
MLEDGVVSVDPEIMVYTWLHIQRAAPAARRNMRRARANLTG